MSSASLGRFLVLSFPPYRRGMEMLYGAVGRYGIRTYPRPPQAWPFQGSGSCCSAAPRVLAVVCCAAALVLACGPVLGAEPEIRVGLNPPQIYEGESAVYSVAIDNVENPTPPTLEGFDDFEVESLGTDVRDSHSVIIRNGQRTEMVRRSRVYNYRLTPRRSGTLRVPAPTAEVDGQTLKGEQLVLEVIAPVEQDVANITISADPPAVYPTQQFTITLAVLVKGLPAPYADQSPIDVRGINRVLQIPWVADEELPEGLRPVVGDQQWLSSLVSRSGGGFGINRLATRELFEFRSRLLLFQPRPQQVQGTDAAGKPVEYWQYRFVRRFVADRIGQFGFGPVTLKGSFIDGLANEGRPNAVSIYAVARPVTVTVKDVPVAGRPASYSGAIGSGFQLQAGLAPTVAKVGDPMTLTLTLSGEGSLEQTSAPDLEKTPEIAECFKVQKTAEETHEQSRRFTYTIRPRKAGIRQLSAVPLSFFNVQQDRYETITSQPIPVQVDEAQQMTDAEIVAASRPAASDEFELQEGGIYANIADPRSIYDQTVRPLRWLAVLAGMAGLYGAAALVVWGVRRRAENPALVRRRAAAARARGRLRTALEHLQNGQLRQGANQVRGAVLGLVADVADLSEAGLTPRQVQDSLATLDVPDVLIERVDTVWEKCDGAQFGASAAVLDQLGREAGKLIDELITELRARRRLR